MSALDALRQSSTIAVDSAAFLDYGHFDATHATTNPSILLAAAKDPAYGNLLKKAKIPLELAVLFGSEILKRIPGHVSMQLDPRLSFDTQGTIREAHQLIELCLKENISPKRILIKIAGTWEGIQAARVLEQEGFGCNVTMVLSVTQALAAAEVGAACIAPYVGRVTDWYKNNAPTSEDEGVKSLVAIYSALKSRGFETQVMAASFRTPAQVLAVSGCDILTIQSKLLSELLVLEDQAPRKLMLPTTIPSSLRIDKKNFLWQLCNNPCASFLLDDGLRRFEADMQKLRELLNSQ